MHTIVAGKHYGGGCALLNKESVGVSSPPNAILKTDRYKKHEF